MSCALVKRFRVLRGASPATAKSPVAFFPGAGNSVMTCSFDKWLYEDVSTACFLQLRVLGTVACEVKCL